MQTHPMAPNSDYYGHFSCPDNDPEYMYSLMLVKMSYEVYSLADDGHLIASHPDVDGRVEHTYDKNMFCLVHRQVTDTLIIILSSSSPLR